MIVIGRDTKNPDQSNLQCFGPQRSAERGHTHTHMRTHTHTQTHAIQYTETYTHMNAQPCTKRCIRPLYLFTPTRAHSHFVSHISALCLTNTLSTRSHTHTHTDALSGCSTLLIWMSELQEQKDPTTSLQSTRSFRRRRRRRKYK